MKLADLTPRVVKQLGELSCREPREYRPRKTSHARRYDINYYLANRAARIETAAQWNRDNRERYNARRNAHRKKLRAEQKLKQKEERK